MKRVSNSLLRKNIGSKTTDLTKENRNYFTFEVCVNLSNDNIIS